MSALTITGERKDAFLPSFELRYEHEFPDREGYLSKPLGFALFVNVSGYVGRTEATVDDDRLGSYGVPVTGDLQAFFGGLGGEGRIVSERYGEAGFSLRVFLARQDFDYTLGGTAYRKGTDVGSGSLGVFVRPRVSSNVRLLLEAYGDPIHRADGLHISDARIAVEGSWGSRVRAHAGWRWVYLRSAEDASYGSGYDYETLMDFHLDGPTAGVIIAF